MSDCDVKIDGLFCYYRESECVVVSRALKGAVRVPIIINKDNMYSTKDRGDN